MEERDNCVYKHTSPSGKVYIGITRQNVSQRWGRGSGYTKNNHLYAAIKKYGWDSFTHEIVADGLTRAEASEKEHELVSFYQSDNPDFGYNLTSGGDSNYTVSDGTKALHSQIQKDYLETHPEHKKKMAVAASNKRKEEWSDPEYRERIIPILKEAHKEVYNKKPELRSVIGKIASDRWRDSKYREIFINSLRSRTQSEETRKLISDGQKKRRVVCLETNEVFDSLRLASRFANVSRSCIEDCCNAKCDTAGGFRWRDEEYDENEWQKKRNAYKSEKARLRGKRVVCVETLVEFQSVSVAAKWLCDILHKKCNYQVIMKCASGGCNTAYGYHWEYVD